MSTASHDTNLKNVWFALILLTATFLGTVGGVLSWLGGMKPANALLAGASVSGGAIMILISVARFLSDKGD